MEASPCTCSSVLSAEQSVIAAVVSRQQRGSAPVAAARRVLMSPSGASPEPCQSGPGGSSSSNLGRPLRPGSVPDEPTCCRLVTSSSRLSDAALLKLRPGLPPEPHGGVQPASAAHSAPLPLVWARASGLPPLTAGEPDAGVGSSSHSACSFRLVVGGDRPVLDQQQDLGLPFLGDGSQRPPSYCSSRSSSGDGGGAGGFLAGRAGEGGGADAADARACAAPPSSAAVNRYGQLLMGSAGWRCTAVYGMDLHDMLLLDRLTPRRTSAAQATPPLTAQQQRNPRTSTPEQSPASCASARPATSNVAPADAAAPVMAAAMEAPAPGGPHTAAGRQPASLAAIALRPGSTPSTPARPSPCTGRPPRGPPAAATAAAAATARDLPPAPLQLEAADATSTPPQLPSAPVTCADTDMLGAARNDNGRAASTASTPTKPGTASFHRSHPSGLQRPWDDEGAALMSQAVTSRQNAAQQPQPQRQLPSHGNQGAFRASSPQIISTSHVQICLTTAASLSEEPAACCLQSSISAAKMAGSPACPSPGNPSSSPGLGAAAARYLSGSAVGGQPCGGGKGPRALGSSPTQPTASPGSPYTFSCSSRVRRRLSESQAAQQAAAQVGGAGPGVVGAAPAASPAQHPATSPGDARCSGGAARPHLSGPDLVAMARQEDGMWGSPVAVNGLRMASQRTVGRWSGRGGSLTSWASVSSSQGQLPPAPSAVRCSPIGGSGYSCGAGLTYACLGGSLNGEGGARSPGLTAHPSVGSLLGDSGTPRARTSYQSGMRPAGHMPLHFSLPSHSHSCTGASPAGHLGIRSGSVASWGEVLEVLREQVTPRATTPRASSGRAGGLSPCALPVAQGAATVGRSRSLMTASFEAGRSNYQSNGGCSVHAPSDGGCGSNCGMGWAAAVLGRACRTAGRGAEMRRSGTGGEACRTSCKQLDTGRGARGILAGALQCVTGGGAGCDGDACGSAARCRQACSTADSSWRRSAVVGISLSVAKDTTISRVAGQESGGCTDKAGTPDLLGSNHAAHAWPGAAGFEDKRQEAEGKIESPWVRQSGVEPDTVVERDVRGEAEPQKGAMLVDIGSLDRSYADARRNSFAPLAAAVLAAQRPLEPSTAAPLGRALPTSVVAAGALALATCLSPGCTRDQATVFPRDA